MIQSNRSSANPCQRNPLVSVIVPVKNSARFLGEALNSLHKQTYPNMEIIVVDGHSTDGSAALVQAFLRRFDRPLVFITQNGNGLADARNSGIGKARGGWIAFLDGDDRWHPEKLERQVNRLWERPSLQCCLGWVRCFLEPGTRLRPGFRPEMFDPGQAGYTPGTLLARTELFLTLGSFDPTLAVGCDSDWFARAIDRKIEMDIVQDALLLKRIHPGNLSAQIDLYRKEMLQILRRSVRRKDQRER